MHESHDTIRDHGDGAAICINCSCCECHRPEVAAAPCAKAEVGSRQGEPDAVSTNSPGVR